MLKLKVMLTAAAIGSFMMIAPQSASANPLALGADIQGAEANVDLVEKVGHRYYRRHGYGHRRYGYGYGRHWGYRRYGYGYHRRYYGGYWPYYGGGYGYPYYGYGGGYCPPYGSSYLSFGFGY
jgi:hypothetical protein